MKDPKQRYLHHIEEGPYYKTDSPSRQEITSEETIGTPLVFEGRVLDSQGNPIPNAWLDFWQADGTGLYDNAGYNLRGHQYTDENGRFRLKTVEPAPYLGRTPHIHLKVKVAPDTPVFTAQLYFPDKETNKTDHLFDPANVMEITETPEGRRAYLDIVIKTDE